MTVRSAIEPYVRPNVEIDWSNPDLPQCPTTRTTPGLEANRRYFDTPKWALSYFHYCHRDEQFRSHFAAATGSWDDKVVVDVGCGPGNVYATIGGKPRLLIGIDIAAGSLKIAQELGYTPLLADAEDVPLVDGFADIVVVNATLHHCDHMERVLAEAARMVAPGGILVTDQDPQYSAYDFRGLGRMVWDVRVPVYRWLKRSFHADPEEQAVALASEIHHDACAGVTMDMYHQVLAPLGFTVELYRHNNNVGAELFDGEQGRAQFKFRVAQRLSGINPDSADAALTIMCRATRTASAAPSSTAA